VTDPRSDTSLGFLDYLADIQEEGLETDDLLAAILPLMEQTQAVHEKGQVAPLDGVERIFVARGRLWFKNSESCPPRSAKPKLAKLQEAQSKAFEVVGSVEQKTDIDEGRSEVHNRWVSEPPDGDPDRPLYLTHYTSWEHVIGHHDALTDIYSLGILMASLALGADFCSRDSLEAFVEDRHRLAVAVDGLHPAVAVMIARMTELNRHERLQDLTTIIDYLRHYRDQPDLGPVDFSQIKGFQSHQGEDRKTLILQHLRDRLFELSKRNRLVFFRPTLKTVNLTEGSVPLQMNIANIRPEQIFTWHQELEKSLSQEETISLNRYLRFEDAPWLSGALDGIRRDANRDIKEYGFAQLRLVVVFLRWHNLKDEPEQRIHSPLLLLPATIDKKKGIQDSYQLTPTSTLAEVNPALRYYLKQLYDLSLPETVDLKETSLDVFHDLLKKQIQSSEKAVELIKIARPQIDLIHAQAKKRLDRFRQRQRISGRHVRTWENIDYSYKAESFQPLGLQLFLRKVKPPALALDSILADAPRLRAPGMAASTEVVATREQYQLRQGSGDNPYRWDFDLCSLTLGNFNYQKMTLVRDYNVLLEEERDNACFEEVFSNLPLDRKEPPPSPPLSNQFLIVPSDPTQVSAIAWARTGRNLIIQGPPGTGKSQTITNLVADAVARGQKVLFVCEKRAALDVVYHRLAQSGLHRLACLIHDSQADKKPFILDLKSSYEGFLDSKSEKDWEAQCLTLAREAEEELSRLREFGEAMCAEDDSAGVPLRSLLERLIVLREAQPELDTELEEWLPPYSQWLRYGNQVKRLAEILKDLGKSYYSQLPVSSLGQAALKLENPVTSLRSLLKQGEEPLSIMEQLSTSLPFPLENLPLSEWQEVVGLSQAALYLSQHQLLDLLNSKTDQYRRYRRFQTESKVAKRKLENALRVTAHWHEKLSPVDTASALQQAQSWERSVLRFIRPAYWKLKKVLEAHYDFSAHKVPPSWSQILSELQTEHICQAAVESLEEDLYLEWDIENLQGVESSLSGFDAAMSGDSKILERFREFVLQGEPAQETVDSLAHFSTQLESLDNCLKPVLRDHHRLTQQEILAAKLELEEGLEILPDLIPCLSELVDAPPAFFKAICELEWDVETFEAGMARKSLQRRYRENRELSRFEAWILRRHGERVERAYAEWMQSNGPRILDRVRRDFLSAYALCNTPAAQLTPEQKEFKKVFNKGRRELEHEFKKTMRFKSVRALTSDSSGQVVLKLKPIWLMSPLSISDILPLEEGQFDLVIFDEASQIRLEEAVPTVYRASQLIVVGDEMQLPPSNFFSASGSDEDSISAEEEGEVVEVDLSAESFLSHSSANLPSTLLGWHYRSRHEALISYSNRAFYCGQLLTIPDQKAGFSTRGELRANRAKQAESMVDELLNRSISFHFMEHGVYEKRRNLAEAEYVARTVKALLERKTGLTIGVVAFSEAQQNEIEGALNRLAALDQTFSNRLAAEIERHEDEQFCGLFVKNLENVQGDERDIVILSICYAPDKTQKMRMNFGPINRAGGEKRLNVIFSRARQHMVVVSSITHQSITNDYNDGARCLKGFLEYSAAISAGDLMTADRVLRQVDTGPRLESKPEDTSRPVLELIQRELEQRGLCVTREVGQSSFRVDLAVRRAEATSHQVGILLDGHEHYAIEDPLERYVLRPSILRAFGWTLLEVLTKDFERDPGVVLDQIERLVNHPQAAETTTESAPEQDETRAESEPDQVVVTKPKNSPEPDGTEQMVHPASPEPSPTNEKDSPQRVHYFTYQDGKSSKFWELTIGDHEYTVRYGRIGSKGQCRTKSFDSHEETHHAAAKAMQGKMQKGYVEGP
jgi:predicted DNA-binding WGR domain protein/very-short-patch-repair endonuclease